MQSHVPTGSLLLGEPAQPNLAPRHVVLSSGCERLLALTMLKTESDVDARPLVAPCAVRPKKPAEVAICSTGQRAGAGCRARSERRDAHRVTGAGPEARGEAWCNDVTLRESDGCSSKS